MAISAPDAVVLKLRNAERVFVAIRGSSMLPCLCEGSRVEVVGVRGRVAFGDLVLLRWGDRLVVHRVVVAGKRRVVTKGDNLPFFDPGLGAVIARVSNGVNPRASEYLFGELRWDRYAWWVDGTPVASAYHS